MVPIRSMADSERGAVAELRIHENPRRLLPASVLQHGPSYPVSHVYFVARGQNRVAVRGTVLRRKPLAAVSGNNTFSHTSDP